MCGTCGCSDGAEVRVDGGEAASGQGHGHGHGESASDQGGLVLLEREVLAKNDGLARANRAWFDDAGILALNVMSSPGAGKTALLERTLTELGGSVPLAVVEGDQETDFDADRLRATGRPVVQINTGSRCHLDADMIAKGVRALEPRTHSVVFIENVGNLVCPALFALGEQHRVVVASTTEGEDKPLKYPNMFRAADLVLLNKIDLLPHLRFDAERFVAHARKANPHVQVLRVSAQTGQGVRSWYDWLTERVRELAAPTVS